MKISLDDLKITLNNEVNMVTLVNFNEQIEEVKRHIRITEYLFNERMLNEGEDNSKPIEKIKPKRANEFIFKKKLIGGFLLGLEDSYIPESLVREVGLESGDLIYVRDTEKIINSLRLVEKNAEDVPDDDLTFFPYATVKYEDGYFFCDKYFSDGEKTIKIDDIPYKFLLNRAVMEKFSLIEGDLVDLGIDKESPTYIKVVWRHKDERHIIPKASSHYKEKGEKKPNKTFEGIDFDNSKILIVGCEPRKDMFESAITQCNGEFSFMTGDEQIERIQSAVSNNDVVLLLRDFLSHDTVKQTIKYAKEIDKPFYAPDGVGIQNVVFETRKLVAQL